MMTRSNSQVSVSVLIRTPPGTSVRFRLIRVPGFAHQSVEQLRMVDDLVVPAEQALRTYERFS
jgi:hypothetical protein